VYSICNHVLDALQLSRRDFTLVHDSIEYPTHRFILRQPDIQDESNGLHLMATFLNGISIHFTRRTMYDLRAMYDVSQLQCLREKVSRYIESHWMEAHGARRPAAELQGCVIFACNIIWNGR
jgi:hypothetical protein